MDLNINKRPGNSIVVRTSCVCGAVVTIMLSILAVTLTYFESDLMRFVVLSYSNSVNKAITEQGNNQKKNIAVNFKATTEIAAGLAAQFLYNMDSELSVEAFKVYMKYPGIIAVNVVDADDQPFMGVWKDGSVKAGESVPGNILKSKDYISEKAVAVYEGDKQGSLELIYTDKFLEKQLEQGRKNALSRIENFKEKTDSRLGKARFVNIASLVFVVIVLIGTIIITLKKTAIKPIKLIRDGLKDVAEGEGDLTRRLEIKRMDEVGELASWFNIFMEQLQKIIKDVYGKAKNLDAASIDISGLSENMSLKTDGLSDYSTNVSGSAKEMTISMSSLEGAIENASSKLSMVAIASQEMISTISEIASNSSEAKIIGDNAVLKAETATKRVEELGVAAREINQVTESITEISEQTNLLALNATIEAARAGDAGKGFAVVANEIKELAKQTSESTQNIKDRIDGIRTSAGETINVIAEISQVINDIADIISSIAGSVEEQSAATNEISNNVSDISDTINHVNTNVSKSSSGSAEISNEIDNVDSTIKDMAGSSMKVKNSAGELSLLASALKNQITKFKF